MIDGLQSAPANSVLRGHSCPRSVSEAPRTIVAEEEKKNGQLDLGRRVAPAHKKEDSLLRGGSKSPRHQAARNVYLASCASPYAHARVVSVDTSASRSSCRCVCAITGKEIAAQTQPFIEIGPGPAQKIRDFPMAVGKVFTRGSSCCCGQSESSESLPEGCPAELSRLNTNRSNRSSKPSRRYRSAAFSMRSRHEPSWNGCMGIRDVERAFKEAAYVVTSIVATFIVFHREPLENNV